MFSYLILNNRCLFLFKFLCTYLFQVANLISKSYCVSFWPPSNCYDMKIIQEFIAIFLLDNVLNIWYVIKRFVFYLKKIVIWNMKFSSSWKSATWAHFLKACSSYWLYHIFHKRIAPFHFRSTILEVCHLTNIFVPWLQWKLGYNWACW